jgi:hypothetical protein
MHAEVSRYIGKGDESMIENKFLLYNHYRVTSAVRTNLYKLS